MPANPTGRQREADGPSWHEKTLISVDYSDYRHGVSRENALLAWGLNPFMVPQEHPVEIAMLALRSVALVAVLAALSAANADSLDPDLIFRKSTTFKFLTPDDKLAVYGIDDPVVEGVACHYTAPEKGGLAGAFGLAEQTSDISLACRQYGPIKFKEKFSQGDVVFSERRSIFFKKMQIVRGCDTKRNILVYMTYSDKLIEGSPKNSTSTVPIAPWGSEASETQKCADFIR
jgi:CreA protein